MELNLGHSFKIYDYDIRFFDEQNNYILEINTFPHNPKDVISLIYSIIFIKP